MTQIHQISRPIQRPNFRRSFKWTWLINRRITIDQLEQRSGPQTYLGFTPLARMVTSDNIISTLSRQSKHSVVSVPAFIWYPHYLNVFYKICYVYCNDGNVFQSTWTTLKTLEEDSAVSGEKNNPLKRSFSELEFVHQIQFHTSLRFRLQ